MFDNNLIWEEFFTNKIYQKLKYVYAVRSYVSLCLSFFNIYIFMLFVFSFIFCGVILCCLTILAIILVVKREQDY